MCLERTFEAPLDLVAENILDVVHTSVLHRGLFRRSDRERTKVLITRHADRVVARYPPERPSGLVARLFGHGPVEHEDEFRLPGCALVRYRRGHQALTIASWLGSRGASRTEMFSTAVLEGLDRWAPALQKLVLPVAERILRQDVWMLGRQTDNLRVFGGRRFIHAHDVLSRHIARLMSDRSRRLSTPPDEEEVELWL